MISLPAIAFALVCAAHPYHVATGEAGLNAETGRLEVAMSCDSIDLERGLAAFADARIDLEDEKAIGPLLERYVADSWRYRPVEREPGFEPEPSDPGFVGIEFEGQTAWVYFTVGFPAEPEAHEMGVWLLAPTEPQIEIGLRLQTDPETPARSLIFREGAWWAPLGGPPSDE